jgi:hypothetical protein
VTQRSILNNEREKKWLISLNPGAPPVTSAQVNVPWMPSALLEENTQLTLENVLIAGLAPRFAHPD